MSSFLKKGKRDHDKEIERRTAQTMDQFNKTLIAMNHVFTTLKEDEELTEENFEEKVQGITKWRFSQRQLDILKRDLLDYEPAEDNLE